MDNENVDNNNPMRQAQAQAQPQPQSVPKAPPTTPVKRGLPASDGNEEDDNGSPDSLRHLHRNKLPKMRVPSDPMPNSQAMPLTDLPRFPTAGGTSEASRHPVAPPYDVSQRHWVSNPQLQPQRTSQPHRYDHQRHQSQSHQSHHQQQQEAHHHYHQQRYQQQLQHHYHYHQISSRDWMEPVRRARLAVEYAEREYQVKLEALEEAGNAWRDATLAFHSAVAAGTAPPPGTTPAMGRNQ